VSEHEFNRFERGFVAKAHQPIVMRIGEAAEKNAVHHAEDRGSGTNPQSKCEYRDHRKCGTVTQPAERKSQVLEKRVEKLDAALVAIQLFGLFDAAKFAPSGVARFFGAHAFANIFFGQQLEVRAKLRVQFRARASHSQESANAMDCHAPIFHNILRKPFPAVNYS
jgi:hypothetical protein